MKRLPFLFLLLLLTLSAVLVVVGGAAYGQVAPDDPRSATVGRVSPAGTVTETHKSYLPMVHMAPLHPPYDMVRFLVGDRRLYEVQHSNGSQARHQTHVDGPTFFHTKGNEIKAEWEELWYTDHYIYRGTDTSPGNGQYYTLRDSGAYGSVWSPRKWNVGDAFERNPLVTFYQKSDCSVALEGTQRSWLVFETFHPTYTFDSGVTLDNVVQLAWRLTRNGSTIERYYYAEQYGLVGWWSNDRGMSYVSEVHPPGARPDNVREQISCLDKSPAPSSLAPIGPLPYWPGEHRR
ncbi:MAG TPA: hypothetical protein VK879_01645 [Candidatus Sulfomarinibacteraceae bacterium]|nr:hypothetical protein [Candidatus Sulfomarinibacteraceae bacterium]